MKWKTKRFIKASNGAIPLHLDSKIHQSVNVHALKATYIIGRYF